METITQFDDWCIIVRIPVSIMTDSPYEATCYCWRANLQMAKRAKYLLGVNDGIVKCVIKIKSCRYPTEEICNKRKEPWCKFIIGINTEICKKYSRIYFEGEELKDDKKYLHKKIPEKYTKGPNPVRYTYA